MERYRNHDVRGGEKIGGALAQPRSEPHRQGAASLVLERVHDRAKASIVSADGAAGGERRLAMSTSRTLSAGVVENAPGGQGIAAPAAERRRKACDGVPAVVADGPARGIRKGSVARRARRRHEYCQKAIGETGEGDGSIYSLSSGGSSVISIRSASPHKRSSA